VAAVKKSRKREGEESVLILQSTLVLRSKIYASFIFPFMILQLAQLIFESSDATLENDPIFCFASQKQEKDESKCLLEFKAPDFLECDEAGVVLANSKKESIAGNGQLTYYAVKTHAGNHQTRGTGFLKITKNL
jgi:hypothetical protein